MRLGRQVSQTTPRPRHSPESRELEQPPDVPGYLIEAPLGRGASAEVWSARSCSDGRRVAVKVVALQANSADSRTPGTQPDAAAAELAVLRGIHHPHVLELIDDIRLADGRMAFVLELASGGSLARVVRARGYLTVGETVTVVSTLATTLRDVHDSGVTHADLAPGNVLFHLDGRPMLADVGLARIAGVAAHAEGGTPGFVDPAVVAGAPAGPMADVYGLGALGWLCLTGAAPRPALLRRPLAETHPSVPDQLAALLEAALDPDPLRRPSPVELAHGVFQAAPAEPVRLAGDSDPAEQLTHRLRALAAADPRPPAPAGKRPLIKRASVPWRSARLGRSGRAHRRRESRRHAHSGGCRPDPGLCGDDVRRTDVAVLVEGGRRPVLSAGGGLRPAIHRAGRLRRVRFGGVVSRRRGLGSAGPGPPELSRPPADGCPNHGVRRRPPAGQPPRRSGHLGVRRGRRFGCGAHASGGWPGSLGPTRSGADRGGLAGRPIARGLAGRAQSSRITQDAAASMSSWMKSKPA